MSGRPSWKSAEIGLFRPFSAFFALFRRVQRAPGKSRKRRKKAFFLRYPRISLNPPSLKPPFAAPQWRQPSRGIAQYGATKRRDPYNVCPSQTSGATSSLSGPDRSRHSSDQHPKGVNRQFEFLDGGNSALVIGF